MGRLRNIKHETFVQKLVGNKKSAKDAYNEIYSYDESGANACKILDREDVKRRIVEVMHLVYNPQQVQKKLSQLMDAKKPVIYNGEITGYYSDNASQIETLKLFLKSANVIGNESANNVTQTFNNQFNVAVIDPNEALSIAKEIKSLSQQIKKNPVAKRIEAQK